MKSAIALTLVLALLVAHIWAVVQLVRVRGLGRGVICLFLPVLAPLWAWDAGQRKVALAWCGAFLLYALSLLVM